MGRRLPPPHEGPVIAIGLRAGGRPGYGKATGTSHGSGGLIAERCTDPRVTLLRNPRNLGVGGAVIAGYRVALTDGMDIVVKLDGDGQMDPELIPSLIAPIERGLADYAKGNRFHFPADLRGMPAIRLRGNTTLSFFTKLSSGYWTLFDPTNGFTAIHRLVLSQIPLSRVAERYFFESDMLYQLNLVRAVVADVPMRAHYGDQPSSLQVRRVIGPFLCGNIRNCLKRIAYNYFLREFNIASVELVFGLALTIAGSMLGAFAWITNARNGVQTSAGTVMLAALPIIVGFQLLLAFLNFDIQSVPRIACQSLLPPAFPNGRRPSKAEQPADGVARLRTTS